MWDDLDAGNSLASSEWLWFQNSFLNITNGKIPLFRVSILSIKIVVIKAHSRFNTNVEFFENLLDTIEMLKNLKSPRLIKSHLPASVLPTDLWKRKNKVIYVTRNVKDALVSAYHFYTGVGAIKGSLEEFADLFMSSDIAFHPFWDHALEFWEMRNEPNIFFTSYERMSQDIKCVIKELCLFLGKPIPPDDILKRAEEHLSFKNMKSKYFWTSEIRF